MRRGGLLPAALVALLAAVVAAWSLGEGRGHPKPPIERRLYDQAGLLGQHQDFENTLRAIFDESDVDIRIVVAESLGNVPLEEAALKWMQALDIGGKSREERGVLFLYDMAGQRLRVEVGYALEAYLPDAFVSYLVTDHVRDFFGAGDPTTGLGLTLRMLHHQIRAAVLGHEFDPRVLSETRARRVPSGGAGVSAPIAIGRGPGGFARAQLDAETLATFGPQDAPAGTYRRYLAWLATGFDPSVPLFTAESRAYLARLPMTRAYFDYLLFSEYGRRYQVDLRGDLALLYFTDDPLVSPHFFRARNGRWEMDLVAEIRDTQEMAGAYTWHYRGRGDDFSSAFSDQLVPLKGYVRLRRGDNTPLPIRHARPAR
jgi:uncharacterized membrane protein YgcG